MRLPRQSTHQIAKKSKEETTLQDFELIRVIGKGNFGKVYQVVNLNNKKIYAMKVIRKDIVLANEMVDSIHLEKLILEKIDFPFIIRMEYVYTDDARIYFIMDFIEGGELFRHLKKVRRLSQE